LNELTKLTNEYSSHGKVTYHITHLHIWVVGVNFDCGIRMIELVVNNVAGCLNLWFFPIVFFEVLELVVRMED